MKIFTYKPLFLAAAFTVFVTAIQLRAKESFAQDSQKSTESKKPVESKKKATQFIRMVKKDGQPRSLDTAVTTYKSQSGKGVQVDLIGAVHIGEKSYYDELNKLFDKYDVLLYELVAPEGTVLPKGGKKSSSNPVAWLQKSAQNMLGLDSQLEQVDYTKKHFVRADMTPKQISQKMEERGETVLTVALSTMVEMMKKQNLEARKQKISGKKSAAQDLSIFDMFGDPLKMKRVMASQFTESGSLESALGGSLNQMLIVDRNKEAVKGLQKQIAAGKKKIGIFYGAAHMPDFERRLKSDFGLEKTKQDWIVAWDLTESKQKKSNKSDPASLLLDLLKQLDN